MFSTRENGQERETERRERERGGVGEGGGRRAAFSFTLGSIVKQFFAYCRSRNSETLMSGVYFRVRR